jgi:hypothetical protein
MSDLTDTTEEVRAYQRAARRTVRSPHLSRDQACAALIRLAQDAREKAKAPEMAQAAIWAESETFIKTGEVPMDREAIVEALVASDPYDRAVRALRRDGYVECPKCLCILPDERSLGKRAKLRRRSLERALIREDAV